MTGRGPFRTDRELSAACHEVYESARSRASVGMTGAHGALAHECRELLLAALSEAGVVLGPLDLRQVRLLANQDVDVVVILAGWIARANRKGDDDG